MHNKRVPLFCVWALKLISSVHFSVYESVLAAGKGAKSMV